MEALEAEMEALQSEFEAYDEDADESGELHAALEEKADRIQAELDKITESLEEPYPDDLEHAGAIVTVDHEGNLRIERGLIRKEDMKKLSRRGSGDEIEVPEIKTKPSHSEKLTRMLTAHRTAAIQAEISNRPEVALAALVHRMALQIFGSGYSSNRIVQVNIEKYHLKPRRGEHRAEPRGPCNRGKAPVLARTHRCGRAGRQDAVRVAAGAGLEQTCMTCWPSARRSRSIPCQGGRTPHQQMWRHS